MALFTRADAIKVRDENIVPNYEDMARQCMIRTPSLEWVKDFFLFKIKEAPKKRRFETELYVWQNFTKHMPEELKSALHKELIEKYQAAFPDCEIYSVDGKDMATYFMIRLDVEPKIAYRYTVEITTGERGRESVLYDSFDEVYDAVNKELGELHKSIGLNWNDPETQKACRKDWDWSVFKEECKQVLDRFPSVQFADFKNGYRTERFFLEKVTA